jgi:hypothetical protein
MDFTLAQYESLCAALVRVGYQSRTHAEFIQSAAIAPLPTEKYVLLRHDVDAQPRHALRLGQIEQAYGLRATYYFRTVGRAYDPEAIRQMAALGHEVGYHYEVLAQTRGDIPHALALFARELARLRQLAPIQTASMHGSPLHPWDNRAIWQAATPQDFGLLGEAYRDIDYQKVLYLNDTGRTWHPQRYNLRDHTDHAPALNLDSTSDLIAWIERESPPLLCLSAHPERWQAMGLAWGLQCGRDVLLNGVKLGLRAWHRQ